MVRVCFWREWGQREVVVVGVETRWEVDKDGGVLITGHRVLKVFPVHILASRPIHPFSVGDCVSR